MYELTKSPMVSCSRDTTIRDAADLMRAENVGCVLVLDEQGRLAGLVTDRDLAVRALAPGIDAATPVRAVMTDNVAWAPEGVDVFEAATLMAERGCRRLPLLDAGGRVTSVLALDDLLPLFARQIDKLARTMGSESRAPTRPV